MRMAWELSARLVSPYSNGDERGERTDPLVVRLVQLLVQDGDVQPAMNPVDAHVREPQEGTRRHEHVRPWLPSSHCAERSLLHRVVQLGPSTDVSDEPREREEVEHGERLEGELDLLSDLVLEEARVQLHAVVEDVIVGEGRDGEV